MAMQVFVVWFCLLGMCFLVSPPHVPSPAQCLISGFSNLIQLPNTMDDSSCWIKCFSESSCHMAVMTEPLRGAKQCLLVNCLNQGNYSYPRAPSTQIQVYPKITDDKDQCVILNHYAQADETLRCSYSVKNYQSGKPRFYYNSTSFRCERFSDCGLSRNTFETREGCEALCSEKFRCYRPRQVGEGHATSPKVFYNVTSRRCEKFVFTGRGSNGNIFSSVEQCEALCADVRVEAPDESSEESRVPLKSGPQTDSRGQAGP